MNEYEHKKEKRSSSKKEGNLFSEPVRENSKPSGILAPRNKLQPLSQGLSSHAGAPMQAKKGKTANEKAWEEKKQQLKEEEKHPYRPYDGYTGPNYQDYSGPSQLQAGEDYKYLQRKIAYEKETEFRKAQALEQLNPEEKSDKPKMVITPEEKRKHTMSRLSIALKLNDEIENTLWNEYKRLVYNEKDENDDDGKKLTSNSVLEKLAFKEVLKGNASPLSEEEWKNEKARKRYLKENIDAWYAKYVGEKKIFSIEEPFLDENEIEKYLDSLAEPNVEENDIPEPDLSVYAMKTNIMGPATLEQKDHERRDTENRELVEKRLSGIPKMSQEEEDDLILHATELRKKFRIGRNRFFREADKLNGADSDKVAVRPQYSFKERDEQQEAQNEYPNAYAYLQGLSQEYLGKDSASTHTRKLAEFQQSTVKYQDAYQRYMRNTVLDEIAAIGLKMDREETSVQSEFKKADNFNQIVEARRAELVKQNADKEKKTGGQKKITLGGLLSKKQTVKLGKDMMPEQEDNEEVKSLFLQKYKALTGKDGANPGGHGIVAGTALGNPAPDHAGEHSTVPYFVTDPINYLGFAVGDVSPIADQPIYKEIGIANGIGYLTGAASVGMSIADAVQHGHNAKELHDQGDTLSRNLEASSAVSSGFDALANLGSFNPVGGFVGGGLSMASGLIQVGTGAYNIVKQKEMKNALLNDEVMNRQIPEAMGIEKVTPTEAEINEEVQKREQVKKQLVDAKINEEVQKREQIKKQLVKKQLVDAKINEEVQKREQALTLKNSMEQAASHTDVGKHEGTGTILGGVISFLSGLLSISTSSVGGVVGNTVAAAGSIATEKASGHFAERADSRTQHLVVNQEANLDEIVNQMLRTKYPRIRWNAMSDEERKAAGDQMRKRVFLSYGLKEGSIKELAALITQDRAKKLAKWANQENQGVPLDQKNPAMDVAKDSDDAVKSIGKATKKAKEAKNKDQVEAVVGAVDKAKKSASKLAKAESSSSSSSSASPASPHDPVPAIPSNETKTAQKLMETLHLTKDKQGSYNEEAIGRRLLGTGFQSVSSLLEEAKKEKAERIAKKEEQEQKLVSSRLGVWDRKKPIEQDINEIKKEKARKEAARKEAAEKAKASQKNARKGRANDLKKAAAEKRKAKPGAEEKSG